jgi:hypothetical protein
MNWIELARLYSLLKQNVKIIGQQYWTLNHTIFSLIWEQRGDAPFSNELPALLEWIGCRILTQKLHKFSYGNFNLDRPYAQITTSDDINNTIEFIPSLDFVVKIDFWNFNVCNSVWDGQTGRCGKCSIHTKADANLWSVAFSLSVAFSFSWCATAN